LCELAGIERPDHLEGRSFAPLLDDPQREWKSAAFSQFPQSIDGKCKVEILSNTPVIKSFAAVGLDQRRHIDIHGYFAETGITAKNALVERFLI
jgi:hypothetical protein